MVGRPPGDPKVVGRHSQRFGSDRETLPKVWKWSGDSFCGQVVVERPSRRSGSGRESLPEVQKCRETLPEVRKCRENLPEVRKWSGDPFCGQLVVERPSRRSGSGRETLSKVRNLARDTPGGPEPVG